MILRFVKRIILNMFFKLGYEIYRIDHKNKPGELDKNKDSPIESESKLSEICDKDEHHFDGNNILKSLRKNFLSNAHEETSFIVSQCLFNKLSQNSMNAFNDFIQKSSETPKNLDDFPVQHYRREVLRLGNYYLPDRFNAETGLSTFSPPPDVHAMVRQDIFCGDLYYCDLITEVLEDTGFAIVPEGNYLDFGCSSGRVVRTLAKAFPLSKFYGCDPNQKAIDWASHNISDIVFSVSPEKPFLDYEDEFFDLIFAISIWSHFSCRAAITWIEEARRIVKPGGLFLWTTHGIGSVKHYHENGIFSDNQAILAYTNLIDTGHFFIDVFDENGDWGVGKKDWGNAFFNPSYVISSMLSGWKLLRYIPRRSESNQDVYLFQKL